MTLPHPKLANWQIPPHFKSVESALEGISVFAPIPSEEEAINHAPSEFKCPKCGATTAYDVSAGGVTCEHCGYQAEAKATQVGLKASVLEFTPEALKQTDLGWGTERQEIACSNCGAVLSIEPRAITTTCPFCNSNKVNLRNASSESLRPRFLIPFKIKTDELAVRTREWLGKGWFHPSELASQVGLDRFAGIYLPTWTFNAYISSEWKAEVGHERQVSHYNSSTKTHETRTEIDWRWENGHVEVNIQDLLISGTQRVSRTILERIYPFRLDELMTYSPDYLAGWKALAYDVLLQPAWNDGKARMREKAKEACMADINGSHVRNFSMNADFSNESWRYILLPVYIATYRFEQKTFQVMVNGQTGLVAGQKPVAWWKIWLVIGAMLAPGVLLGLIGIPLMLFGGLGLIAIIIGAVLLIIGLVCSGILYKKAIDSEAV